MTPAWEKLAKQLTTPTDVFIYRFNNNDPINRRHNITYMTGWCHITITEHRNMFDNHCLVLIEFYMQKIGI
jgi:hypothetical protein